MKKKTKEMDRNKMENMPQEMLCNIFSFVSLEGIIRMRQVNKRWKNFIECNLKFFYSRIRNRRPNIQKVFFFQNFVTNIRKYKIGLDWEKRNFVLQILKSFKNRKEKSDYLVREGIKLEIVRTLLDSDNRIIERYLFLRHKDENNYTCQLHAFSNWDDLDLYRYIYLRKKDESPYLAEKMINYDDNQIRKFLLLREKGESPFSAETIIKEFDDKQISTYMYLRSKDIYPYSAKIATQKFNEDQIVRYLYLVEKGISTYRAESIVSKIDDETLIRFIACLSSGLNSEESNDIIENLTSDETRKFLTLKAEGINELNSLLITEFDL